MIVSRRGSRRCNTCGSDATSSFVPMHAPTCSDCTETPNLRVIQRAAAARNAALPADAGYPLADSSASLAARRAISGTGSHGVPIEQSTTPPGSESARRFSASRRSYGYGGGTKPDIPTRLGPRGPGSVEHSAEQASPEVVVGVLHTGQHEEE